MSELYPSTDTDIDDLFPQDWKLYGRRDHLDLRDLPYLTRPIIERIHDIQPHVVIAGDRGARLLAVTAIKSWRRRFPSERFPTLDRSIHLARVTSRSASKKRVSEGVHWTLNQAGLAEWKQAGGQQDGNTPRVMYIDDWSVEGKTGSRFVESAMSFGIPAMAITYATMCGPHVSLPRGAEHFVTDPGRDPGWSVWDTQQAWAEGTYTGVRYSTLEPTIPIADHNEQAVSARRRIEGYVEDYYDNFTAAMRG